MEKNDYIEKLEHFKQLLDKWDNCDDCDDSKDESILRSEINKNKDLIKDIILKAGTYKLFDYLPPRVLGNYIIKNMDPFNLIFEPYVVDISQKITDMIDETIGVIERTPNFSLEEPINEKKNENNTTRNSSGEVFIVHGHDNELKEIIARFIETIELKPIILNEKANSGLTIIEKFEKHSDVEYAIVLLSPDDLGNSKKVLNNNHSKSELNNRARQNVIFELGYFFGKLGRKKVCAIKRGDIEIPSDNDGILYIPYDDNGGWKISLIKELKNAGFVINAEKILK
jgi:predicted nucleotide-binding protein